MTKLICDKCKREMINEPPGRGDVLLRKWDGANVLCGSLTLAIPRLMFGDYCEDCVSEAIVHDIKEKFGVE